MLLSKGWLIHRPDGKPDSGGYKDVIGPNLDTTNPEAAKWFWEKIRDRYVKPYGFDYIWLDETEPDIDPAKDFFFDRFGNALLQRVSAVSYCFGVRRIPSRFWRQPQGDDPGAGGVPGSATQRHGVLVERYRFHMGHAQAVDSGGTEFYGDRNAVLGHGHCGVLLAVSFRRTTTQRISH